MLKSRRGLLAAGLAVAVVGALGVASTLNASAEEQVTGSPGADQQPVAAAPTSSAGVATPPPLLPWGARPQRVRKGPAGVSARTLRADGFDAASDDTSGSILPRGRYAPKGELTRDSSSDGNTTGAVPAAPPSPEPGSTKPPNTCEQDRQPCNLYDGSWQYAETDGAYVNVTIAKPSLDKADYHTLGEIAVQGNVPGDDQAPNAVEVGWTVDRGVNGDDDPHLFVYHWVNHQGTCYNGCGWQQYSKNLKPGDTLAYGIIKQFGIQYFNGAWWIAFDSEWIGYFPEQLWNDQGLKFNRSNYVQVYGEVSGPTLKPCSEMGNGQKGDSTAAAYMASIAYLNGPDVKPDFYADEPSFYPMWVSSGKRVFRYGGPGAC